MNYVLDSYRDTASRKLHKATRVYFQVRGYSALSRVRLESQRSVFAELHLERLGTHGCYTPQAISQPAHSLVRTCRKVVEPLLLTLLGGSPGEESDISVYSGLVSKE